MDRILIIGATGRTGRQVISQLTAPGLRIRALVRDPQTVSLPPHVQVVQGDLTKPQTLDETGWLDGVDSVFLVWNAPPATVPDVLERIVARARHIVFLSSPHKTPHPFFQQPNPVRLLHAEIERLIETSGRQWTFLRPGMFAANALGWWGPAIRAGHDVVRWPHASASTAPIDGRDIAAVAVRALCEEGHDRAEYVLTGPESLTQAGQLSIIGDAIGRPLRMEEMSPDEARREWSVRMSPVAADMLLDAWAAATGQPAFVTSTVAEITGAPARTFREWATSHAGDFRA